MKKYPLSSIISAENNSLLYIDENGIRKNIDLKRSGIIWWERYNKNPSLTDRLFKRKSKNKYVGSKRWIISDEAYISFWNDTEEIKFVQQIPKQIDGDDYRKIRSMWENIITQIQSQGFLLFDEG